MWMLLLHQLASNDEVDDPTQINWSATTSDIPQSWKTLIERCVEVDPNKRIGLLQLTRFWEKARGEL